MEHVGQTLRLVSRELRYRIIIRTKISLKDESRRVYFHSESWS